MTTHQINAHECTAIKALEEKAERQHKYLLNNNLEADERKRAGIELDATRAAIRWLKGEDPAPAQDEHWKSEINKLDSKVVAWGLAPEGFSSLEESITNTPGPVYFFERDQTQEESIPSAFRRLVEKRAADYNAKVEEWLNACISDVIDIEGPLHHTEMAENTVIQETPDGVRTFKWKGQTIRTFKTFKS